MDELSLKEWIKQEPFEPFVVSLSNGESYEVHHPEMIVVGKRKSVIYNAESDSFTFVAMVHVNSIKPLQSA